MKNFTILIKPFFYLFLFFLFYIILSLLLSLSPIFFNIIGFGATNAKLINLQKNYYFNSPMRSLIQGNAGCVMADETLAYKQKKGDCEFNNFEFETVLKFNSNGALMSDTPKTKSKVMVLGDSHAMGWGVSYNETFSYLLSLKGFDVTNLSMSSYATEQEILSAIQNVNFKNIETIVIQYCENDIEKNKKSTKEYFPAEYDEYRNRTKSDFNMLNKVKNSLKLYVHNFSILSIIKLPVEIIYDFDDNIDEHLSANDHKFHIINILKKYPEINTKKIFIFYSNTSGKKFLEWNELIGENIEFIDLELTSNDYYKIDDHLNSRGHAKIATKLNQLLY